MDVKASTLIIDGYGFAFRAYFTQSSLTYKDMPVGCIYGFSSMLMKLINDFKPRRAVVVFDHPGKSFRNEIYPEYKQHRPPVPADLILQLPLLRNAAKALNFKSLEVEKFEADDVIASLAKQANFNGDRALIVSSDKDLMQLINDKVWMFDPVKQEYIKEAEVIKKFGVPPSQIIDFLSIVGDSADNVPGIKGLGPKTAAELLQTYGSLEEIYKNIEQIKQAKRKDNLLQGRDLAFLSQQLVVLRNDLDVSWDELVWSPPEGAQILHFLQQYGFNSLITRAEKLFHLQQLHEYQKNSQSKSLQINIIDATEQDLNQIEQNLAHIGTCSLLWHQDCVLLSSQNSQIYKISLNQLNFVQKILSNASINKITFDLKTLLHKVKATNAASCNDIMLMYYAISAGNKQLSLPDIIAKFFSVNQNGYSLNGHSCAFLIELYQKLLKELKDQKALYLYCEIDLPLCHILYEMEKEGIDINREKLLELSKTFALEAKSLEDSIIKLAGYNFNLASSKQLGEVLFDKLNLPGGKKSSKSQSYTTGNDVLEQLKFQGHEIANLIIEWRHLTKLKNTYTDALPVQINPKTNKLHTTFLQNNTTTGRLASLEPNLQNIPIRTKEGLMIRSAFTAPPGWKIISADYSQIELRILAEVADIKSMKEAFIKGIDIHTSTASEIFSVPQDQVSSDLRRRAKAINFGIIYGISAYGLAQNLQLSSKQAQAYIDAYMEKYPEIQNYFKTTKDFAAKHGYVENIFTRKCFIPGINDKNFYQRSYAERAAINARIQSSAADIAKLAMIKLDKALKHAKINAHMILQVHDSILLLSKLEEVEKAKQLTQNTMEQAANLSIPLIVDVEIGDNWQQL